MSGSRRVAVVGWLGSGADADLSRLDLFRLRDAQGQDAIREGGVGPVALDADGKLNGSAERAETSLTIEVLLAADLVVGLEFATKGEVLARHRDLDVLGLHAREGGRDDDLVGCLMDVDGWGDGVTAAERAPTERADE